MMEIKWYTLILIYKKEGAVRDEKSFFMALDYVEQQNLSLINTKSNDEIKRTLSLKYE